MADVIYYELSWAILSSICIITCLIGCLVVSVAGLKAITSVPIIVSVAGALANGLCFYAFYNEAPRVNQAVASVFADTMWMIQEAGLSFYSYFILTNLLKHNARRAFLSLFWTLVAAVFGVRTVITTARAMSFLREDSSHYDAIVMKVHHAYFVLIFSLEALSAFFLLRSFSSARRASLQVPNRAFTLRLLVQQLILSTELRLATLCLIGVSRAILYAFRTTPQTVTNLATQLDRFVYTVECLFPVVMMFDILSAKLIYAKLSYNGWNGNSANSQNINRTITGTHEPDWPLEELRPCPDSPTIFPVSSLPLSALK